MKYLKYLFNDNRFFLGFFLSSAMAEAAHDQGSIVMWVSFGMLLASIFIEYVEWKNVHRSNNIR